MCINSYVTSAFFPCSWAFLLFNTQNKAEEEEVCIPQFHISTHEYMKKRIFEHENVC